MSIDKVLSQYKTEVELRAFAEAQQKTLMQVMKKNKELQEEVEHLKKLVAGAVPIIKSESGPDLIVSSDEEEIAKIKAELEEDGVGRPKDSVRYGKDDHPEGRDPLGIKTLKQKEGSVQYKPRKNSYFEVFKDMNGGKKKILTENLDKE